eukprot:5351612-Alexandrium_andersonii.AAC.1
MGQPAVAGSHFEYSARKRCQSGDPKPGSLSSMQTGGGGLVARAAEHHSQDMGHIRARRNTGVPIG